MLGPMSGRLTCYYKKKTTEVTFCIALSLEVTLEEVNSQIALEYGQAMTVRVLKADGEVMRTFSFIFLLFCTSWSNTVAFLLILFLNNQFS